MSELIQLKNVSKQFMLESGVLLTVLEGLNLSVPSNRVVALLGPSGCGKSTTLRILAGLLEKSSGEVIAEEKALVGINKDVAMVFQSFALLPWETVFSNVSIALDSEGMLHKELRERVKRAIDLVGLEGFEEAYPRELSGGMKQRVGIARALVLERPLLFLDEPFSALDVLTADTLRAEMVKLFIGKQTKTSSIVLVTHNIQEAVTMAQDVHVMGINPGHIRKSIEISLPYPRDENSGEFLAIVSEIHKTITEALMPDVQTREVAPQKPKKIAFESLPNAQITEMIGLLETIYEQHGQADIFELAHETHRDFGSTLYLVKAAEIFNLVETPKQTVVLKKLGRDFVSGDINVKKKILHNEFGNLQIVQAVTEQIKRSSNQRLSLKHLIEHLSRWLENENPQEQAMTLISWGRFAEYLGYNDNLKEIYRDVGDDHAG